MRGLMYGSSYYTSYFIYVVPALIIALLAQAKLKSTYAKYSRTPSGSGYTGYDVARMILDRKGLHHVEIYQVKGQLTDHYDPRSKSVKLSEGVYSKTSIAAVSVAAHEVGHAIQDAEDYVPLKWRSAIAPLAAIGSNLVWFLIFLGAVLSTFFMELGVALFMGVILFQLVTLPVEFNASSRALSELENGIIGREEVGMSKSMLNAAAMTYVAATIGAIAELLRILSVVNNNRD